VSITNSATPSDSEGATESKKNNSYNFVHDHYNTTLAFFKTVLDFYFLWESVLENYFHADRNVNFGKEYCKNLNVKPWIKVHMNTHAKRKGWS